MAAAPTINRARVASRNGAPRIAPIPISPVAALLEPRSKLPRIATSGIMVSGNAVPTAASTLPTAPAPRFSRSPVISTALVKRTAAPSIAARDRINSIIVTGSPYGHLRRGEVRYLHEFAALDLGRSVRKGVPEVVYARGKSPAQVAGICATLLESCERVILSAPTPEHEAEIQATLPEIPLRRAGRSVVLGVGEPVPSGGRVGALSAGTSDLPVLEEALAVAGEMGASVMVFHDVGVAGVHRLAAPLEELREFDPDCLVV